MKKNLARAYSAELEGIAAKLIEVEVDLNVGLHAFNIVGLADKALNEAKERVNSALKNTGVKPPNRENRKITVNLAPADVKKAGSQYDLAIALGYLAATNQIGEFDARDKIFLGELALDGRLRPVSGALNVAELARHAKFQYLFVPRENANEAAAIPGVRIIPLESLQEAIDILEGRVAALPYAFHESETDAPSAPDMSEIKGQEHAKRALTIAAAGAHNLIMIGPPGVGKSLLAQALTGILPRLTTEEAIEVTKVWSAAGLGPDGLVRHRPFRTPHHTASLVSVVGGGSNPRPGEISLAHCGVLFLDELPEFPKNVLESLRQPIESGTVHVARARGTLVFPAKFSLIAAMNPCPCGYYGDPEKECKCTAYEVIRYQKKISGPLLDRIDLQIRVPRVPLEELRVKRPGEPISPRVRNEVEKARKLQAIRFKKLKIRSNSEMSSRQTEDLSRLDKKAEGFLSSLGAASRGGSASGLSPRGYYRLVKTARTIADLEGAEEISAEHLAEAWSYRLREEV